MIAHKILAYIIFGAELAGIALLGWFGTAAVLAELKP